MASSPSDSPAKQTRFFKIIPSDIGSHTELMVPIKFADVHGNDLNDRIFLKVPSGLVWSVDLERRTNRVWLQNGWPEFANHYSIRGGHMLLFNYLGDSQFEVSIFDSSSIQIDYSLYDADDSTRTDAVRPRRMTRASSSRQQVQLEKENRNGESKERDKALASAELASEF